MIFPGLKQIMEASTRRITTTLTFREGAKDYSVDVVEWFCIPQTGLTTNDQLNAAQSTATTTTGTTGTKSTTAKTTAGSH